MSWDYRVLCQDDTYRFIEVYYNDDDSIMGWCDTSLIGDKIDDLRLLLNTHLVYALNRPVLVMDRDATDDGVLKEKSGDR